MLQPFLEKISGRIAVSAAARQVQVEHLGGDAVEIPNGVAVAQYAAAAPLPGYPRAGGTVGFLGRYDEPRKGMPVLLDGAGPARPGPARACGCWSPAAATPSDLLSELPPALAGRVDLLGQVSEADKARMLRSVDVYCAPNLGGESFGIILLEAMAAGAPIVASDLDAVPPGARRRPGRRAVPHRRPGRRWPRAPGRAARRPGPAGSGWPRSAPRWWPAYDWPVVARQVVAVYETVDRRATRCAVSPDTSATPDLVGE